jgi:hypothetical protein
LELLQESGLLVLAHVVLREKELSVLMEDKEKGDIA